MIIIACKDCGTAVRVSGDHAELSQLLGEFNQSWYPDKYPCPTARCQGKAEFMEAIEPAALRMLTVYDLTPHEAYSAFNGLGLPEEQDCGPTAVEQALKTQRVTSVEVSLIRGSNRSVLYNMTLADGTIIYFGSSPFGATIYRMSRLKTVEKGTE